MLWYNIDRLFWNAFRLNPKQQFTISLGPFVLYVTIMSSDRIYVHVDVTTLDTKPAVNMSPLMLTIP